MFSPFCKTQVKQEDKTGTSSTNSISQSVKEKMNNLFTHQDKVAAHSHKHRLPFNLPLSLQPFYPPNLSPLPLHPTQLVMNQNSLNFNMYGNHYSDVKSIRPPKDYLNYSQLNTSNLNQLNLINEMMKSYSGVTAAIHIKSLMSLMNSFPLFPNFDGLKTPLLSHESSKKLSRKPNVQAYSKMSLGPATSKLNDTLHYKPNKTRDPPKSDDTQKTKQDTIIKPVVMRGITKPKTHMCPYCGKFYSRKYGLKIHIRTHTGYKPLKCKVSDQLFISVKFYFLNLVVFCWINIYINLFVRYMINMFTCYNSKTNTK